MTASGDRGEGLQGFNFFLVEGVVVVVVVAVSLSGMACPYERMSEGGGGMEGPRAEKKRFLIPIDLHGAPVKWT